MPDTKKPWEKNYTVENTESQSQDKKPWEKNYVSDTEKKNSVGTSTSTIPTENTESAQKTGSSVSKSSSGFPEIDTNGIAPNYEDMKPAAENPVGKEKRLRKELANTKVTPENMEAVMAETDALSATIKTNQKAKDQAKSQRVKELETSFYDATRNNNDDAVAEQRLNDAVNTNGIWNNVKSIAKKTLNIAIDGAVKATNNVGLNNFKINDDPLAEEKQLVKKQALKNKENIGETEINQRAQQIFKEKEKDNLFLDRANSFLDNMDAEDKNLLKQDRYDKTVHLQEDNLKRLKYNAALQTVAEDKISDYKKIESQLTKLKENGEEFPEDLYSQYTALGSEIQKLGSRLNKNEEYVLNNKKDLGTAQQEFDLFKREYGDFNNIIGNIAVAAGELGTGILGAVNYASSLDGPLGQVRAMRGQEVVSGLNEDLKNARENLRTPVESIESAEGFLNYTSDLVANQIPNLVATSTGIGGLAFIGATSTGQKYTKMNDEVRQGKETYSPLQMAVAPLLYGGAEVISEIPTLSILKKGGRVIESIARNEGELITKTAKQKALELAKDYSIDMGKEMTGEQFTNFTQNFNDKFVLGKKDVNLLDNTGQVFKDTFTLTSILKVAPHTFGVIAKPFQSKTDLGTLDENSRKIIEFSRQLNTEGLTDTEKKVIQKQIDKATAESSKIVANTIGKIGDMPGELYDEVVTLNTKAGEIKAQAREINDGNLPNKEALLKGLGEDYKALQEKRNGIIEGNTTVVDILPLKEQDLLKKQALEDLVTELNPDGKKNIKITNEQVVERANEIYAESKANESNKTQTSQPSSSEEATPSVNAKIEGNSPLLSSEAQENGSKAAVNLPTSISEEQKMQFGAGYKDYNFKKENVSTDKIKITEQPSLSERQELVDDIKRNGITEPIVVEYDNESDSYYVKNGNHRAAIAKELGIKEVPTIVAEYKETNNEAISPTNTPADGNIQSGTGEMGESGIAQQESPVQESVQSSVDGGKSKGDSKPITTKKVKSVKDGEFDVDFDEKGNVLAIRSSKDGRVISKFVERKVKPSKQNPTGKILSKNANYAKIEADAKGETTENEKNNLDKEAQKIQDEKISSFEPGDEYEIALKFVAEGGKVKLSSARNETGEKNSKAMKWASGFNKESDLPSIEKAAESLMPYDSNLDEGKIRDSLIEIFTTFESLAAVKNHLLEVYDENNAKKQDQERHSFLGSLSEKDFAMYQAIQAEDNYLAELSDAEVKEHYNQKINENEQGQQEYARSETANQRPEVIAGRNDGAKEKGGIQGNPEGESQGGNDGGGIDTKSTPDQILEWLENAEKELDAFGLENLSVGIPIVVAKAAIQAMKIAVKAGKLAGEVIQAGLDAVKQSDWYKNLTQTEQDDIENDFNGNFLNKISNINPENERQTENLLNRAASENISEDDAYAEVKSTFDKARTELSNKKSFKEYSRDAYRNFVKRFTDRQYLSKSLLNKSGMKAVQNLIINSHGASGRAKIHFEEAYNEIYKKLTTVERRTLDEIIQAKRFIAIDSNREARGLEPVSHPNFIDKNKSEKFLSKLEKELGTEKYNDLARRAEAYFKTYKGLLKDMLDNGLISKESFDSMSDVDYQPRVFLQFVTDFNGDLETTKRSNNMDSSGLSSDQIKSMSEGDASILVLNSEWLLTNSLLSRSKAMAMNNINKRFMTGEFQKAQERFNKLDPKNLKGDDVRFYKYFKELSSKVIDNPFIGKTESGTEKYKFDKTPANFAKAYYYVDGQRHEFFLEKELHESWNDNFEGVIKSNYKEFISYASGAALVKAIATGNNPAFPIVNTPRDFLFTIAFSAQYSNIVPKAMLQVAKDVVKSIKEIRKPQSDVLKKYIEYGGAMDFLSSQGTLKKESLLGQAIDKSVSANTRDAAKSIFSKVTLHKISSYSEMMFRLGIFQRSIKNQLDSLGLKDISEVTDKQQLDDIYSEAVSNARSILDFNQGGVVTKDLEAVIPYINVAFQGGRVAASAFENDPVGTTVRVLQLSTIASTIPIGMSLALISAMKSDDDKDKSSYEIYLHALEGISKYQKMKYMNIVTGNKNDEGEYQVIKIAKAQELSPVMSVTDDIYNNFIRSIAGKEKKSIGSITQDALFTFNSTVMPVDFSSPGGFFTRTPMVKATLSYLTGFDFFREEPLSMDIGKVPKPVEGITMSSTEDFYKKLGENYGLSPIRSKAFVESLITGPSTNPFVGMLYGGADAVTSDKDMKQIGKELFNTVYKSTGKRVISYSSDFNRQLAAKKDLQDKIDTINMEKYKENAKFNDLTKQYISKEISKAELHSKINELDPGNRNKMYDKVQDKVRMKDLDGAILDIKYEQGNEAKALMIMHYYGDIFDGSKDSKGIIRQMQRAKGILTPATLQEYNKIKDQLGTKKTSN